MTTSSALTPEPSTCRLQRMHGPEVRDAVAVLERRVGVLAGTHAAPDHRDEVRVVRAVELVGVRDARRGRRESECVWYWLARRVVRRLRARGRLGVEAGHDHDAVVVARRGDRRLDLAVACSARRACG